MENELAFLNALAQSLIRAVREKQLFVKGMCLPLDPTGRWWKTHIRAFEDLGAMLNLGQHGPTAASSAELQSPLMLL